jgi:hypothetical protein
MRRLVILAGAGFAAVLYGATAPTNDLGSEKPYGIVSSTYSNTAGGTTVTGGVCFTTGPDVAPTVSGSYGACPAAAGTDQSAALAELNHVSQDCTVLGAGPLEGISINGGAAGTFPPGCYERAAALDISVNGIVTLNGAGVYIFKSTGGALTTGANSQIVLTGACANNVFWAPVGLTTLGATSTFIGNVLDAAGVTLGLNATMTGRALAFGGTVTTNGNTITVPADCPAATHLIINKVVVNNSGGVLTPTSFAGTITGAVVATGSNTWAAASTDRTLTQVGAYNVTETAQPGYTATFSAGCSGTIHAGSTVTCTITNTDNPTHLIINKVVVNNSSGVLTPAAFSGTIGGAVVATGGNTWAGASTDRLLTTAGAYSVAETAQADYTSVLSADCSGTIAAGETKTCTVTNTDIPAVPTLPQALVLLLALGLTGAGYFQLRRRARI